VKKLVLSRFINVFFAIRCDQLNQQSTQVRLGITVETLATAVNWKPEVAAVTWSRGEDSPTALDRRAAAAAAAMTAVPRCAGSPRLGGGGSAVALAKCRGRLQRYGRLGSYWCQRRCGTLTECGARCTKTLLVLVNFAFLVSFHHLLYLHHWPTNIKP